MFLSQKEQILQVFYYFNIMKVIVVKCMPLQNVDLLREEGKKEDNKVIN